MIEVGLLGRVAVTVDGAPLSGEAAQRRRVALVALLCVPTPRSLSRDRLMLYLWPESGGESARHLLSVAVHVLRKALGHETLLTNGDEVALAPEAVRVDVAAFEEALRRGDSEAAVSLYGGPFMDGFHAGAGPELEEWVAEERTRLERAYAQALEGAAVARSRSGDASGAVEAWRKLAALDPYSSHGALGLMRALADAGNRAAAIRHAAVHRQLLEGELGAGPDPEVEALAEALRVEPPVPAPPPVRPPAAPVPAPAPMLEVTTSPPRAPVPEATPSPPPAPHSEATPPPPITPESRPGDVALQAPRWRPLRHWRAAAVALLLVGLTAFVGYRWRARSQPRTLAVLPLTDASARPGNEHLGDGISDAILNELEGVEGLRVAARTSSFAFRGETADVRAIGRKLGVQYVLGGSLEASDTVIRVNVELASARTGLRQWRQTFVQPLGDLFAIQDSIARAVAAKLNGRGAPAAEAHRPTLEALHLYLKGMKAWYQRTPQSLTQAVLAFEQAMARDSDYARAYAGLAQALVVLGSYDYGGLAPDSAYPRARAAALRALALDSTLPDARTALGAVYTNYVWDFARAEAEFRHAIELAPGYSPARQWLGLLLVAQGRNDEALRQLQQAGEVDPLSPAMSVQLAHYFYYAREFDRSAEELERALAQDSAFPRAHLLYVLVDAQRNRSAQAIARAEALRARTSEPAVLAVLGYAYARAGRRADALAVRDALVATGRTRYVPGEFLVLVDVGLGENDRALQELEQVRLRRSDGMVYVAAEPAMAPLASDPRFQALVRAVGVRAGKGR